jgi:hypothetical protein
MVKAERIETRKYYELAQGFDTSANDRRIKQFLTKEE